MKILVIEDDLKIASMLKKGLEEEFYTVDVCHQGDEGLYLAQLNHYDVILLDVMLPQMDGMEICKRLRASHNPTPIIMLTAKGMLEDKIKGLNEGANDYLVKPFSFEELLARIRVQLRNSNASSTLLRIADLEMDTQKRKVSRGVESIKLSAKEYALLEYMMRNPKKLLSETMIKENLSNMEDETMSNVINVYIYRLRTKIDKAKGQKLIHTIRGAGYMISDEDEF